MRRLSIKNIAVLLIVAIMSIFLAACDDLKDRLAKETGSHTDSAAGIFEVSDFVSPSPELLQIDDQAKTVIPIMAGITLPYIAETLLMILHWRLM